MKKDVAPMKGSRNLDQTGEGCEIKRRIGFHFLTFIYLTNLLDDHYFF